MVAGIPYVSGSIEILVTDTIARRRARGREAADATRQVVGNDELLLARLSENDRLADMFLGVIDSATRTALRGKRVAMGKVVGQAVLDDAFIDDAEFLEAALRDLSPAHFRALVEVRDKAGYGPMSIAFAEPIQSGLLRQGLVLQSPTYGGSTMISGLSPFGEKLLDYVIQGEAEVV